MHNSEEIGGPLANPTLRQAIGYAIDYDGIVNGLMSGAAIQPATIAPEPLPGTLADPGQEVRHRRGQGAGALR